ncbi:unnamed protein product [Prorocentrum cordatum]|uniref:EF-hand domain-containing protein n=1 Tax=Prorocentrum cordatum TaxID=2364126 RepID=A0ABN9TMJ2_9DINO|nr:unnamed protein product [Polarella glacialis]
MVSCAPPSVQLSGRWVELDTDGDGNWTREEAQAAASELYCKYHVNAVEVFDVFVTFLVNRENIIWIHPAVRAGKGIPKSYFKYAAGDIIMCGYRNADMCPNLLKRGFFDAPLKHGTVPRVGTTTSSALKYCYDMLDEGGICDRTLPSTYTVWKKSSEDGPVLRKRLPQGGPACAPISQRMRVATRGVSHAMGTQLMGCTASTAHPPYPFVLAQRDRFSSPCAGHPRI